MKGAGSTRKRGGRFIDTFTSKKEGGQTRSWFMGGEGRKHGRPRERSRKKLLGGLANLPCEKMTRVKKTPQRQGRKKKICLLPEGEKGHIQEKGDGGIQKETRV